MAGLRRGVVVGLGLLLALALSWSGVPAAQGAGVSEAGKARLKGRLMGARHCLNPLHETVRAHPVRQREHCPHVSPLTTLPSLLC